MNTFTFTFLFLFMSYSISITEITSDNVENKEIEIMIANNEYALIMVYNTLTTDNVAKCKKTMEDLESNFKDKISFYYSDLEEGEHLNTLFNLNVKGIQSEDVELKNCLWTFAVYGQSIPFHNQSDDYEVLKDWIQLRLEKLPTEIKTSQEFYKATSEYFAGIYTYSPSDKESSKDVQKNKELILNKVKALSAEFPTSKFYYSFNKQINDEVKVANAPHTFIMARGFEDGHKSVQSNTHISLEKMRNYISRYRYPFIMWWSNEVADFVEQEQQDIFLLIVRKRKNYQLEATFERIARSYENKGFKYAILEINGNKVTSSQRKLLDKLKIGPKSNIPTVVAMVHNSANQTVKHLNCDNVTEKGIQSFIGSLHGEETTSHCLQNQFLKRGWSYTYVKPINYDWLVEISTQITPINQVIFFYRSHDKFDRPLTKKYIQLTKELSKLKKKPSNFYIFDYRLNEAPQYLIDVKASVPGVLIFNPDNIDSEGKYNPVYNEINEPKEIYKIFDELLEVDSKLLLKKAEQKKKKTKLN